jgi:hypothetical protein
MDWMEKDKKLFKIINHFGRKFLEKQIEEATQTYFKLNVQPSFYIIFGYYNTTTNLFNWENKMNEQSFAIVKSRYMNLFGSDFAIKKLFKPIVRFDNKYACIIPYLMDAFNKGYNVICIKSTNCYIYALTRLEGINKTFNNKLFENALINYKNKEYNTEKMSIKKINCV